MAQRRPQLPKVDPDYQIEPPENPERLHDYAAGLLAKLRGDLSTERPYPKETIKAATSWLIWAYAEAGVAPSPDAAALVKELVQPDNRANTLPVQDAKADAYWAAVRFEAGYPRDPTGKAPSNASRYAVAKFLFDRNALPVDTVDSAESTVRRWRDLEHYRMNPHYSATEQVMYVASA
jgi:hypothetical protein